MDKGRYLGSHDLLLPCTFLFKFFIIFMTVPHGMWGLSSLIRDRICALCCGTWNLNHWTAGGVPALYSSGSFFTYKSCPSSFHHPLDLLTFLTSFLQLSSLCLSHLSIQHLYHQNLNDCRISLQLQPVSNFRCKFGLIVGCLCCCCC